MTMFSKESISLSCIHNGKTPFLKISDTLQTQILPMDTAAGALGVSRQTLARWCEGTQKAPTASLRLLQVLYLGYMPWPEWNDFRMVERPAAKHGHRWLMVHPDFREFWTRERLMMMALSYDAAAEVRREMERQVQQYQERVDLLQATVTALSTKQPPPLPCAQIEVWPRFR